MIGCVLAVVCKSIHLNQTVKLKSIIYKQKFNIDQNALYGLIMLAQCRKMALSALLKIRCCLLIKEQNFIVD